MVLKRLFAFFLILAVLKDSVSLCANEELMKAISERNFKKAIQIQLESIDKFAQNEKSNGFQELAYLYLKDQDQEKAFEVFLRGLDLSQNQNKTPSYDQHLYQEIFVLYMDPHAETPQANAAKLLQKLLPLLKSRPDEYLLDYFAAIAYANLSKYDEFFKHFAKAYPYFPSHYLAYKTKAILHIKLLERTRSESERLEQRRKIIENLLLAIEQEPHDTTIYKLLISFSPPEKKCEQVRLCLNKIINGNIMIPRSELMFYVIEAVEANKQDLAERFITIAKEWYPQSRMIASAQKYLDAHK